MARKLGPADPDVIAGLLDDLEARGWLSEQRVVDQLLRAANGRFGVRKVMQQLAQRGVSAEEIVAQARKRAHEGELDNARAVWLRRFGKPPANLRERARQVRFLEQRGFDSEVVRKVVGGEGEE